LLKQAKDDILNDMVKNVKNGWQKSFRPSAPPGGWGLLISLALFSLAGCPAPVLDEGGSTAGRAFRIQSITGGGGFYTVYAQNLAEGAKCQVFVENNRPVSAAMAWAIANEFDQVIYPLIAGVFGDYMSMDYDVDGNGKLTLLLVDIQDGYTGTGGYVAGYFDPTHLLDMPNSNRTDMLVIDVNPQTPGSTGFYTTIAHELQHLINCARHDTKSQELWLNEGLSAAAEYLYGGEQWGRIKYFNDDEMGTIRRGNNFFVWEGHWENEEGDVLANYATAYLFFRWLGIQGKEGSLIYSAIAASKHRDYQAVTQAAASDSGVGFIPSEISNDEDRWNYLLSSWMIANQVQVPSGPYGYKDKLNNKLNIKKFKPGDFKNDEKDAMLYPGEGIYSDLKDESFAPEDSGPHIKYLGITSAQELDRSSPYSGEVLLTYNANPQPGGDSEKGHPMSYSGDLSSPGDPAASPAAAVSAGAARSALPSGTSSASYPIGVHDLEALRSARKAGVR
jgi:hypothetical protein